MATCSYDFPVNSRVVPREPELHAHTCRHPDGEVRTFLPEIGTVKGYAGRGDYCLIVWDNAPTGPVQDECVHWLNLEIPR